MQFSIALFEGKRRVKFRIACSVGCMQLVDVYTSLSSEQKLLVQLWWLVWELMGHSRKMYRFKVALY